MYEDPAKARKPWVSMVPCCCSKAIGAADNWRSDYGDSIPDNRLLDTNGNQVRHQGGHCLKLVMFATYA
eukprot:scaffold176304_cov30-Tisochrysis_lutea.AAC.1